jgi:transcriptional antiterminator NusG
MGLQESPEQFEREPEESKDLTESQSIASDENISSEAIDSLNVPGEGGADQTLNESDAVSSDSASNNAIPYAEGSLETEVDGPAWYVIHCYSGYENKVRHNLEQRIETMGMKDMIFDVVIPTQEEIEVKDGKRRSVERHIFPGYVLVNLQLTEESWYVVRNTPGVTGFVGMGNNPTPLRPEEVSQIIKRMEADAPTVKVTYKVGERVRIIDGPFNDFRGVVSEIDMERTKVRVMVSFFGRETPVELDFLQVEKA